MVTKAEAEVYWDVFILTILLLPFALYFKAVWAFFMTPKM